MSNKLIQIILLVCVICVVQTLCDNCPLTAADIEGPYYQPGAPNRTETGRVCAHSPAVDRLILRGRVVDSDCSTPLPHTRLDIWQADGKGAYSEGRNLDSDDFGCRAVVYTDANGFYTFTTVFPGRYDDGGYRPAHIHWKISPVDTKNYQTLTTQLYFKFDKFLYPHDSCEPCNSKDPSLIASVSHTGTENDIKTYEGTWNIILSKGRKRAVQEVSSVEAVDQNSVGYKVKKAHILVSKTETEIARLRMEIARMNMELGRYKALNKKDEKNSD